MQAGVRVGGGPSGIVYGLQVPPQALVPAPGVGLSHAGGGKVRAGGLPLLGGACRHRSAPGAAVAPAPCFLCEIWAQIWAQGRRHHTKGETVRYVLVCGAGMRIGSLCLKNALTIVPQNGPYR